MKTATLVLLEWVDSHIKALKEIEQDKGHSFVIEGGIKALEEVREEILRVSNEVEPEIIQKAYDDGLESYKEHQTWAEESGKYFKKSFKTCPQP